MVVNAIAPWEGKLAWVGTPSGGYSQTNGEEWKSVEFVLAYTDGKLQERHIHLNAFGVEKVNRLLSTPLGTTLRVTFSPTAREYNGKWYGKNEVFGISVLQPQAAQPQQGYAQPVQPPQAGYPQYPQQGTMIPPQVPAYQPQPQPQQAQVFPTKPAIPDDDIPF